jgi:hypothetical protein
MVVNLDDWIARIRDRDAVTFEDAYWGERPAGPDVVPRLLFEMRQCADGFTRGKFLELLGEMGNVSIVPELIAELTRPEVEARRWAVLALEQLGVPEGVKAARQYRLAHPEEV